MALLLTGVVDHCVHADLCGGGVGVVVIVGVGLFVIGGVVTGGFVTGCFVTGGFVTGCFVTGGFVTGCFVTGGFVTGGFVTGGFVVVVLVLFEAELLLMSAVFSFEDSCRPSLVVAAT